jgi:hypothetical protein
MTAKFPTGIADPLAMPEVDDNILRPDFSTRPDAGGAFSDVMSRAMNRNLTAPKSRGANDAETEDSDASNRAQKARAKTSANKKDDNANCTDAPVTTAPAAPPQATTPASGPANQDSGEATGANAPVSSEQEGALGSQGQVTTVGTELPNLTDEGSPKAPSAQAVAAATQLVEHQAAARALGQCAGAGAKDGMSVAPLRQQMKFTPEKDEIAGRTQQKLPRTPAVEKPSEGTDDNANGQAAGQDSRSKLEVPVAIHVISSAEKFSAVAAAASSDASTSPQSTQTAPIQVERISRLVNQEAVMIKQSGATSLAVSLKVDSRTELFLQLTNHDGQLQAALRLERGDFTGLDRHWGQLQDSLARQNIQLLPLEQKSGANGFSSSSEHSAQRHSDESPEQQRGQFREAKEQSAANEPEVTTGRGRGKKTKKSGGSGFDSWA